MARTMAMLVMEGEVPSATLHLSFETEGSKWTFPLRKDGFFRGYNCMKDLKLAGVLQTNMVAVDVEQLEPAANEDESQSSTENAAKQPVAVSTPEEALMASESLRTLESPEDSTENAPKQPVAVATPEEGALMAPESLRTLESPEDSTENAPKQPVAVATPEEGALMAPESLRTLESPEDSTENAPKQPVAVATPEEGALMAPESLRTLESPETSNVLAAEGSPERRKRKQLAGRAVGRIPPRSALKLLQREEEEMKICSLDEYEIFDDDEEVASLLDLPLHYRKHTLGGSTAARELYVMGKADNLEMVMRRISAWHLKCFRDRPLSLQLSFLGSDSW
jgi:predicted SPOUT superfamily RNA methylase MTH1